VEEGTFFANIVLRGEGGTVNVDSRPSDALALAVRAGCPIFADESVLAEAGGIPEQDAEEEVASSATSSTMSRPRSSAPARSVRHGGEPAARSKPRDEGGADVRVVAFSGSARKDGNTAILVRHALSELEAAGVECEFLQLAGKKAHGCTACGKCAETRDGNCTGVRDFISDECIPRALEADGIIIASPVYFADVTSETKALIDRLGYASRQGGNRLARKVGAAIIAVRRAGAIHAFDTINHLFLISEMMVVGSTYWNVGYGRAIGDVEADTEAWTR